MISAIKTAGQFLDQPLLVAKFKKAVPGIMVAGAAAFDADKIHKAPKENKKKTAINTTAVLTATVASALAAPKMAAKVVGKEYDKYCIKDIKANNKKIVDNFLSNEKVSDGVNNILQKAKDKVLNYKEIKTLRNEIGQTDSGDKFIKKLIPEPENVTAHDIRKEIGRLSLIGLIPVAGGVAGGIAGEKMSEGKITKKKLGDKVKEGTYQYLANIFLCNIGAGLALAGLEKANIKSKSARALGMVGGIVATGIVGGSAIANFIGKHLINPIFDGKKPKEEKKKEGLNSERKPEIIDICLHTDDIATVAVMSGLKWIEPALPILYGISGYRAGIGYRNGNKNKADKTDKTKK